MNVIARLGRNCAPIVAAALCLMAVTAPWAALAQKPNLHKVTLVLEWTGFQPQHFGFWLAKERGWYADEGLDVDIKSSRGSAQVMQLMAGGQAEFGNMAASSLVQAKATSSTPLKMVAVFGQQDSLSMGYFQSTGIHTPKDLEGRTVGVVPGSMAYLLMPAFAEAAGFDMKKVQFRNWDFRSYYGIWGAKKVDASANYTLGSTGAYVFKKKGEIVKQFVFSDYLPLIGSGVVVDQKTIAEHPDEVRHFVDATVKAWKYLRDEPKKAVPEAAAIVKKHFDEVPPADVLAEYAYDMIPDRMRSKSTEGKPMGWSSPEDWKKMIDLLVRYDPKMKQAPKVDEVMTNEFVK
jgi:NitT/TauT family transport system substrate-binding protein